MDASAPVAVVEDPRYAEHCGPDGHPERPERLTAVHRAIESRAADLARLTPREAAPEELLRVHDRGHLERVAQAVGRAPTQIDADTFVAPRSLEIARLAAGGTIDLARRIAGGELRAGFAAVRPPGHHAESDRAMGFCLFNNIALAARALQVEDRLDRILIVDWDVHHGNGTQHCFESDPSVLFFSTHQFPLYPGTGDVVETGRDAGEGFTVNVPMPAGCGDEEYVGILEHVLVPIARDYRPEMILVSCGFDAHRDDPLAAMGVTGAGYGRMTEIVGALADDLCGGRLACVLEGGYALTGLREGTEAVLNGLLGEPRVETAGGSSVARGGVLEALIEANRRVHARNFFGLGKK